jgi:serine/threonine protein phosphatase PrpC
MLGGVLGGLLPPKPQIAHRRGETGVAQVRLELSAQVLLQTRQLLLEIQPAPIDREALVRRAQQRACGSCSLRRTCPQQKDFTVALLENPLEADCRKQGRLVPELQRAGEHLRILQADRKRQSEYRAALAQQYGFLSSYLRNLADRLPRKAEYPKVEFRIELSASSRGKEAANGDRCYAFAGSDCRYYVLLCDGMGTGLGAAQEGQEAGALLRQMLGAGFPAEHALKTVNSLLALRGAAGAVTVDLAEISLESGIVHIYKWGAAPSWVLSRRGAEKIGTATPPPGIGVESVRMAEEKLSLRRGEMLILLSDGVEGEEVRRNWNAAADTGAGELAARLLERESGTDDATAVIITLEKEPVAT